MTAAAVGAGPRWRVLRIDNNGNRFILADDLSAQAADQLIAAYECKGHKQTYFKERQPWEGIDC